MSKKQRKTAIERALATVHAYDAAHQTNLTDRFLREHGGSSVQSNLDTDTLLALGRLRMRVAASA